MEDFTESEVQQSWWNVALRIQKVPLQGFFSVPAGSVGRVFAHSSTAKVSDSSKKLLPLSSPVPPKFPQSAIVRLWKYPCPAEAEAFPRGKLRHYKGSQIFLDKLTLKCIMLDIWLYSQW